MGRDTVNFDPNVPVELSLAFPQGKIVPGKFGQRVMYSLDFPYGHAMFLDLAVSQKISNLQIQPGEHFFLCKRPKNGSVPARWDIWLSPATEQMRAQRENTRSITEPVSPVSPSMLERQLAASIHEAQTRKAPQSAPASTGTNGPVPVPRSQAAPAAAPQWAGVLEAKANALVDVYAACLERGLKEHGGRVKPDEIRALLTTVYIAMTKNGASSNAA